MPSNFPRLCENTCGLLVIDLQEKFVPVIHRWDTVLAASVRLVRFFQIIQAPVVITEQYPKGLGRTVAEIRQAAGGEGIAYEKTCFSSCGTEEVRTVLKNQQRRQWVICGIEAHVCVLQTVLDLRQLGYETWLAADAIGSRHAFDLSIAQDRMEKAGGVISTSESLIFEILKDARHPKFKQAAMLVKM